MIRFQHVFIRFFRGVLLLLIGVLAAVGCSNITNSTGSSTPDLQDVQTASQIIGESMATNSDGMMSSMGDVAVANNDGFNFSVNPALSVKDGSSDDSTLNSDLNFSVSYDSTNGLHTITYDRTVNTKEITKEVKVRLEITFRDSTGAFMRYPQAQKLESIDFKDLRKGSFKSNKKNSTFDRQDTLFLTGLRNSSSIVSINGSHNGNGDFQWADSTGFVHERTYTIRIVFVDVTIPKNDITTADLSQGVTGTLTYDITMNNNNASGNKSKHLSGTIELNGNGTALLRFAHFSKQFLIQLNTGNVEEDS